MFGLRAIAADLPRALGGARWRSMGAVRLAPAAGYLSGLTVGRVGLVLLICAAFTVRQHSVCVFQVSCGMLDGGTLGGFLRFLTRQFVFALPMLLAVTLADNATLRSGQRVRMLALAAAVLLGGIVHGLAFFHTQPPNVRNAAVGREWLFIVTYASRALLYGGLATALLYLVVREREDARAMHAARLDKASLDRQTIEARLQALQAQIEPHFLFNTLANIKTLCEAASPHAKPLIHDLAAYLGMALPQMRDAQTTLQREVELADAYLRVLQVRMGERLRVIIDIPPDLRAAVVPPMMLLTLVENAVKHGLGPLPRGGTIAIRATHSAAQLRVAVIDDGIGFPKGFGAGVGLSNTRARLAALYGTKGRLTIDANPRGGVIAVIELPCEVAIAERRPA